jgi:hypothetical protein
MRKALLATVALAFLGLAPQAQAALTVVVSTAPNFDVFDSHLGQSNFTDENGIMWSGTGVVVQGSVANQHAAPAGDATPYMAVTKPQTETATWASPTSSLLIYWGSIDGNVCPSASCGNDNTITLWNGMTLVGTVDGALLKTLALSPADGNMTAANTNEWIKISGVTFTSAKFTSTGNSFEFDMAKAIPETSTWAMMVFGFAGLGYAAFRRSAKDRGTVVAI